VHGPNGFFREMRGSFLSAGDSASGLPEVHARDDFFRAALVLTLSNQAASKPCTFTIIHHSGPFAGVPQRYMVGAGRALSLPLPVWAAKGWYDFSVKADSAPGFLRRLAGHVESPWPAWTDPQIGVVAPSTLSTSTPVVRQGSTIVFDYSTPIQKLNSRNWIGVFPSSSTAPDQAGYRTYSVYQYASSLSGQVTLDIRKLAPGSYKAWFLANDAYAEQLAGPVVFTVAA